MAPPHVAARAPTKPSSKPYAGRPPPTWVEQRHIAYLLDYLEPNEAALVHYAARRRRGEPIATSFVENAVNEIIAWRMAKAQQMRWSKLTVSPFLDVRTAVLNDTLEDAFRHRHHGFRPANDDHRINAVAA